MDVDSPTLTSESQHEARNGGNLILRGVPDKVLMERQNEDGLLDYVCKQCDKSYLSRSLLCKHIISLHPEKGLKRLTKSNDNIIKKHRDDVEINDKEDVTLSDSNLEISVTNIDFDSTINGLRKELEDIESKKAPSDVKIKLKKLQDTNRSLVIK